MLIMRELGTSYRELEFESEDVLFGVAKIYVRAKPIASLSTPVTVKAVRSPHAPILFDRGLGLLFNRDQGKGSNGGFPHAGGT